MPNLKDRRGERYGHLVAMSRGLNRTTRVTWDCVCDCGRTKNVAADELRGGKTRSCGCAATEERTRRCYRHGMKWTPEYNTWQMMKERCHNPNNPGFHRYGGRGISVCDRWRSDFTAFYADMGPSNGLSIERKDNNGNYEPDNCKWATRAEQARNTRRNIHITSKGRTMVLIDWARELGISRFVLAKRLAHGKTIEQIAEQS